MDDYILKGDILYSRSPDEMVICPDSFLVCVKGTCRGISPVVPSSFSSMEVLDYSGHLIVPGLYDLHIHAPQYSFRGLGLDLSLLDWLQKYAYPEESVYNDPEYARRAYRIFANDLMKSPTARAAVFATLHADATFILMEELEKTGLKGYAGKVCMDRNAPSFYVEPSAEDSLSETVRWYRDSREMFRNFQPILTPRFTISCTNDLMDMLGLAARQFSARVQSHLSESPEEIALVKELCPEQGHYIDTYVRPGLIGQGMPSLMAHCVYSDQYELNVMRENDVYAVHCPQCNMNLASGLAPVRRWLQMGLKCGLGTDIGGGSSVSIFRTMLEAMQVSRLVSRLIDPELKPLSISEVFYLGTKGGGSYFGKCGSFEDGYELDALVLDESSMPHPQPLSLRQRLERYIALSSPFDILHKFVAGKQIF